MITETSLHREHRLAARAAYVGRHSPKVEIAVTGMALVCACSHNRNRVPPRLDCLRIENTSTLREGVPQNAMLASCRCTGMWRGGLLEASMGDYSLQCVFVDGQDNVYQRWLSPRSSRTTRTHEKVKLDRIENLKCGAPELWKGMPRAVGSTVQFGTLTFDAKQVRWSFPRSPRQALVGVAQEPCGTLLVTYEESIEGYYFDTLHRAPGYQPARLETCDGREYQVPFGTFVDPKIWTALERAIPTELKPFDPVMGPTETFMGDGWRTREQTRRQEVKVFVRAKIAWSPDSVKTARFLEVDEVRPNADSDDCASYRD